MMDFPYDDELRYAIVTALPEAYSHARAGMPEEVVGLILSDGTTRPLINQARSSTRFEVSFAQMAEALASINPHTHLVYAIYHSHPAGSLNPSTDDQNQMRAAWSDAGLTLPWVILNPSGPSALWWIDNTYDTFRSFGFAPLEVVNA